ncbi:MAG: hypothetical protein JSS83_03020 [Cyanobacteria bacterium SZAS LIN-3]|nr:hypothetical protein [Cyanobacteria bacterium SZAS LIN-3]
MKFKASKLFVVSIVAAFGMAMGLACGPILAEDKPQPLLKEITMVGNKEIPACEIARFFDGQLSRPIDPGAVVNAVAKAEELYHERGFVLAKITEVEDAEKGEIKLVIDEGILDAIEISGNHKTKDFVIRNNLKLKPASAYNDKTAFAGLNKIFSNGYFSDIRRSVTPSVKDPGKFTLKIEVDEKRSGSVHPSVCVDSLPLGYNLGNAQVAKMPDSPFNRNMISVIQTTKKTITALCFGVPQLTNYRLGGYFAKELGASCCNSAPRTGMQVLMSTTDLRKKLRLPDTNVVIETLNSRWVKITPGNREGASPSNPSPLTGCSFIRNLESPKLSTTYRSFPLLGSKLSVPRSTVGDFPRRPVGVRDGRPVAEGPHTKFSEDTPHTEQSWTY